MVLLAAIYPALVLAQAPQALDLSAQNFEPSAPFRDFWGTQPLGAHITPPIAASADGTNNSALGCGTPPLGRCMFSNGDEWLRKTLPMLPAAGKAGLTLPFTRNLSAVRMLGGLTTGGQGQPLGTVPLPELDLVYRDTETGALVNNFSRMDTTLDVFVANGITPSPLVLDNIPFAFVRPENRFYGGFGLGSAPDNETEFGAWVGELAQHLVERYSMAEVSRWRFRLGTEADGPRMGPRWAAPDGNGVIAMPTASGALKNFSHGLDQYIETYLAVSFAIKKVIPGAAFGPSNFAGLGGPEGPTATPQAQEQACTGNCAWLDSFARRIHAAHAPFDFGAMSHYSSRAEDGSAPPQRMVNGALRLGELARLATTGSNHGSPATTSVPIEVHEFGWASWGKFKDQTFWPHVSAIALRLLCATSLTLPNTASLLAGGVWWLILRECVVVAAQCGDGQHVPLGVRLR